MNMLSTMNRLMEESRLLGIYPSKSNKQESIDAARTVSQSKLGKDFRRRTEQGRNELCNCGSGKKFKNCCGRVINE